MCSMAPLSSKWKKNYSFLQQGLILLRLTLNSMKPSLLSLPPKYGDFRYMPLCSILRLLGIESRLCICSAGTIPNKLHLQPQPMLKNKTKLPKYCKAFASCLWPILNQSTATCLYGLIGFTITNLVSYNVMPRFDPLKVSQILAPKCKTLVNLESIRSDLQLPLYYTPG